MLQPLLLGAYLNADVAKPIYGREVYYYENAQGKLAKKVELIYDESNVYYTWNNWQ